MRIRQDKSVTDLRGVALLRHIQTLQDDTPKRSFDFDSKLLSRNQLFIFSKLIC